MTMPSIPQEKLEKLAKMQALFKDLSDEIMQLTPDGAEQVQVAVKLEEAQFWAIAAIHRH